MEFLGEHLVPGQMGHLAAVLSFVAALLSSIAYFFATEKRRQPQQYESWRNIGRFSFLLHGLATLGIIASLFFILTHKMYEYQYAQANVSDDLPGQYIFSAFWKEQQGSFLLWSFWHIVLAMVVMLRGGKWETPVLAIVALAEAFIASMLLGIYFGDWRFGASPFDLLRESMNAPIFQQADYLSKIKGNGLNPLLQNYWMTIHPPTLFLGFASTIIPFSYAMAGLWLREHKEWLKPALKWSLFSGAILGTGILMGAAWAYEALTFAGYWAWDPVENTSLVPWLVLVAGIHANLIARSTGYSIRGAYGLYLLTFLLVLYSTYLTRSGILGDSSAHAFTEMGLGFQLVLFMAVFSVLGLGMWVSKWKEIPQKEKEESSASREFWMSVGALVLLISAILITGATSLPVINKLFGTSYAIKDQVTHHNSYQLPIAICIGLLAGLTQFFRYGGQEAPPLLSGVERQLRNWALGAAAAFFAIQFLRENNKAVGDLIGTRLVDLNYFAGGLASLFLLFYVLKFYANYKKQPAWLRKFAAHLAIGAIFAFVLMDLNAVWIPGLKPQLYALLFASMFAIVCNVDYLFSVLKGNLKLGSSVISHVGFGLLVLGIMYTGLGKTWISSNSFAMEGLIEGMGDEELKKNITLMKEAPMPIKNGFEATYERDTVERQTRTFTVRFKKQDKQGDYTGEEFVLHPNVMYDRQFSKIVASNPSTEHYWNYDIFTNVQALPKGELDQEFAKSMEDSLRFQAYEARIGDTVFTKKHYLVLEGVTKAPTHPDYHSEPSDLAYGLKIKAYALNQPKAFPAEPMMYIRPGQGAFTLPADLGQLQMRLRLTAASMERLLNTEETLRYTDFPMKQGEEVEFQGYKIRFKTADKDIHHPNYKAEADDIAVAALLEIAAPDGRKAEAAPVYLIRNNQPFSLKDEAPAFGLHFRFEKIDPQAGLLTIGMAQATPEQQRIPFEIAENAPRSDYIVLQAIVFPGINFVWLGAIMMMLGLGISLWRRLQEKLR